MLTVAATASRLPALHSCLASGAALGGACLALHGLHSRHVLADLAELIGLGTLAGGTLQAQRELLALERQQLAVQLIGRFLSQLTRLHQRTCRFTKLVETESLAPARRKASRASASLTPSISNSTLPGLTLATQYSTLPLPLPMRTSRGFLVMGTSGNTRIQICPPRFT